MPNDNATALAAIANEDGAVFQRYARAPHDVERLDPETKVNLGLDAPVRAGLVALYEPVTGEGDAPADLVPDHEEWVPVCRHCDTVLSRPTERHPYPHCDEVWCAGHPKTDRKRPHAAEYRLRNRVTGAVIAPGPHFEEDRTKEREKGEGQEPVCWPPDC